jgi:alpha-tubulin suppressor-like RCC1 family protein
VERAARAFRGPPPPPSLVEQSLRQRAAERGAVVPAALPAGETSWVQFLSWRDRLAAFPRRRQLAAGINHAALVDASGRLLTCGTEEDDGEALGVLGHGVDVTEPSVLTPVPSLADTRVRTVTAGANHTLVLTEAGAVLSFGYGGEGRLGHGNTENQLAPKVIEALRDERVVAVSAGCDHSLVLTEAGAVLSFGSGGAGQLGHGDTEHQLTPKVIEALRGERVVAVAGGQCHYVCVLQDGRAFGWGVGEDETLGLQLTDDQLTPLEYPTLRL